VRKGEKGRTIRPEKREEGGANKVFRTGLKSEPN